MKSNLPKNEIFMLKQNVKKYLLTLILLPLITATLFSQTGLKNIIVEKIRVTEEAVESDDSLSPDAIAYRVFVEMAPDWEMQMVNPNPVGHGLTIETTTKFYNNADVGGTFASEILDGFIVDFPSLAFDSYITIDGATKNKVGILVKEDTLDGNQDGYFTKSYLPTGSIGDDFSIPFGNENYSGSFTSNTGIYNVLGGIKGSTAANRVLIGQFTTDGVFSFKLGVQLRYQIYPQTDPPTPAIVEVFTWDLTNLIVEEYYSPKMTYTSGPKVSISVQNPQNGSSVKLNDSVSIEANTTGMVDLVEFYINDEKVGEDTTSPFIIKWKAEMAGQATIYAVATDKDEMQTISASNIITVSTVGVNDYFNEKSIAVYPNPVNNALNLRFISNETDNYLITVLDLSGKVLITENKATSEGNSKIILDVSSLNSGLYFIRMVDKNGFEYFEHFIKQ